MFVVKMVDLLKETVGEWVVASINSVDDVVYLIEGSGNCDCNRHNKIEPSENGIACDNARYIIVDYQASFPILWEEFPYGSTEGYRLTRSGLIREMNLDYPVEAFGKAMRIYDAYREKEIQKVLNRRNLVAVDKGALQMVINVLTNNGKLEQASALRDSSVDIEDHVIPWYLKHHPGLIDAQKEKES